MASDKSRPVLKVLTAGATREGLARCVEPFAAATGIGIEWETSHGHLIRDRLLTGEAECDVAFLPSHMIDDLDSAGLLSDNTSPVDIGAIRIGAAVRAGQPVPDVSDMDALRRVLRKAHSIVLTEAPSGVHMERVIDDLGVRREVDARITRYDTGTEVNEHLVAGTGLREVGFGVATEILFYRDKGISYAGPLPDDVQMTHLYQAALLAASRQNEEAVRLFEFLAGDVARAAFAETGVERE